MERRHQPIVAANNSRRRHASRLTSRDVATAEGLVRIKFGGRGTLTAVFIGGAGEGLHVWDAVTEPAAEFVSVLAYDRLGLGRSGPAKRPRDAQQLAVELARLLDALRERAPVMIVAHSAGAFVARMFAHLFPARIASLLLVEPSHEEWLPTLKTADPDAWLRHMQWRYSARQPKGRKLELAAWDETIRQMKSVGADLPQVPTTIISGTAGHAAASYVLFQLHERCAREHPHVRHVIAPASGHHVQNDSPEVIVNEIERLADRH